MDSVRVIHQMMDGFLRPAITNRDTGSFMSKSMSKWREFYTRIDLLFPSAVVLLCASRWLIYIAQGYKTDNGTIVWFLNTK